MSLQLNAGNTAAPTLLLEVRVAVGPGRGGGQVSGGWWGEVLCLVQAALLIGSEIASRAQNRAGCNARQLGTQKVSLCSREWRIRRHLQTAEGEGLTDRNWTKVLSVDSLAVHWLHHASLFKTTAMTELLARLAMTCSLW